ncbi:hypothetical protein EWM64_g7409 [Hericium alpestre]|uniref:EamA domain-containing protein n=1 Tax=Hericium alpestre TaxID=135208 RepID=A0A4Y9ZQS5_9AGAM|nr:hypothetical protein EWM64_g7409 [Hericium alpestre]
MMAATRASYTALTPELTTTFPPSGHITFTPAPEPEQMTPWDSKNTLKNRFLTKWRSSTGRARDLVENNAGLLLVAASQFFFSLMNVAVKALNNLDEPVPTLELVFVRMSITYICSIIYMYLWKVPNPLTGPPGVRLLLASRGFFGFFGLFGIYYSLSYLSLSDATVLTFLAPLFTGVAGAIFLKENFSRKELIAGLCSFAGVVLIARPQIMFGSHPMPGLSEDEFEGIDGVGVVPAEKGTPAQRLVAVGIALLGVLGATGAYTSLRAIGRRAHAMHSLTSFSQWCVIVSTVGMIVKHQAVVIPKRADWIAMLIMIGAFGFIAQALLTMGLQRETAGRGTMAVYIQIIFALALERIFFHIVPSALSITGTVIIMSSALYIAVTKERANPKQPTQISLEYPGESALEEGLLEHHDESLPLEAPKQEKEEEERLEHGVLVLALDERSRR